MGVFWNKQKEKKRPLDHEIFLWQKIETLQNEFEIDEISLRLEKKKNEYFVDSIYKIAILFMVDSK